MMQSCAKPVCFAFAGVHASSLAEKSFLSQKTSVLLFSQSLCVSTTEDFQEAQGRIKELSFVLQTDGGGLFAGVGGCACGCGF